MENEKNGRNVCNGEDHEQEDEKIEQFFALIKSFRDARNRRRNELYELEVEDQGKKKMRKLDDGRSSWVPSFKWEDFTEEVEFRSLPLILPTPCSNKKKDKKVEAAEEDGGGGGGGDLDLKLTL